MLLADRLRDDRAAAAEPGYDYILQGLAGWMNITGEPEGPPTKSGLSMVDYCGGFVAAMSLLAGLHAARRDGVGMDCDVSLFDTAIGLLTYPAAWHLNAGFRPVRTRHSAHPSLVPFQAFGPADGWMVVGCAKEKFWQRLVRRHRAAGAWATDPRFATFADRDREPGRAAAAPRGDLPHPHRGGVARAAPRGGDAVRAHQRRRGRPGRAAHRGS